MAELRLSSRTAGSLPAAMLQPVLCNFAPMEQQTVLLPHNSKVFLVCSPAGLLRLRCSRPAALWHQTYQACCSIAAKLPAALQQHEGLLHCGPVPAAVQPASATEPRSQSPSLSLSSPFLSLFRSLPLPLFLLPVSGPKGAAAGERPAPCHHLPQHWVNNARRNRRH